jgi:hypothetical protein
MRTIYAGDYVIFDGDEAKVTRVGDTGMCRVEWMDKYTGRRWKNVPAEQLTLSLSQKRIMYKIEDPHDPDIGWMIYPDQDSACRAFIDLLDAIAPDEPSTWIITAVKMSRDEFDALPKLDR